MSPHYLEAGSAFCCHKHRKSHGEFRRQYSVLVKKTDLQVSNLDSATYSYMTLDKLLRLSVSPQFQLDHGNNNSTPQIGLLSG